MPKNKLRKGYTTGACAAAAAKAAAVSLLTQEKVKKVLITLPSGERPAFDVAKCRLGRDRATCSVIKDAGDDPDITNRAIITAEINGRRWELGSDKRGNIEEAGIIIRGGKGVGIVTKPGLAVAVGEAAINPVPLKMIRESVLEALNFFSDRHATFEGPLTVTISIPNGQKLAKKTLNPRLGIKGGISVLGTTGVVIPVSMEAFREAICCALDVACAMGRREIVLCPGRSSEKYGRIILPFSEEAFVLTGDHLGFALKECLKRGVLKVILLGQLGKLSKIAEGKFQTHYKKAKINLNFIQNLAEELNPAAIIIKEIKEAPTARAITSVIIRHNLKNLSRLICLKIKESCRSLLEEKLEVESVLISYEGEVLGRSD